MIGASSTDDARAGDRWILVDAVRVNAVGEHELKNARSVSGDAVTTSMRVLHDLAGRFLMEGDGATVARSGRAEAAATMRALFDASARLRS